MSTYPQVGLGSLDTVWFQISGNSCNLACSHCLVSASPTNRTHEMISYDSVRRHLADAAALGAREYYFTGGEPFLHPQMEAILAETLRYGPATVLTNGLQLDRRRCARLAGLSSDSDYSLDFRVSMDGYDAGSNDPIRGAGTFERILRGIANLVDAGLNPVITVTEVRPESGTDEGRNRFYRLLRDRGITRPRLKVLPLFRLGAEADRSGGYESWQRLVEGDSEDGSWDHLQCSSSRMITASGVWVCPILVNEPSARLGERLADGLGPFSLRHQACWTCHVQGATCRT